MKLEDVARQARVSASTVSRVLNNTGRVKSSTRARVLRIAEELHYRPDIHAQTLAGGKSHTLGLIVSNLQNPFFLDIFHAVESNARQSGYELVVANTDYNPKQLESAVRWMQGHRLAGLALIVSEKEPALIEELRAGKTPVVFYDVGTPGPRVSNIRTDYSSGMQKAVKYLHSLGHRRMAFVGHHAGLQPLQDRKRSFVKAVGRYEGQVEYAVAAGSDSPDGGREAMRHLLESGATPTAVLCVNDFMALGVLRALREAHRRVPEDVSVIGFDNIHLSEFTAPPLTTVNVPREQIGLAICSALLPERARAHQPGYNFVIEPELLIRDSTGPAPLALASAGIPALAPAAPAS
jgi:LacI family transcriptional regulator